MKKHCFQSQKNKVLALTSITDKQNDLRQSLHLHCLIVYICKMRDQDSMIPKVPSVLIFMILNTKMSSQALCFYLETATLKHWCLVSIPAHATFTPQGTFSARSTHCMFLGNGTVVIKKEKISRQGRSKVGAIGNMWII